MRQRLPLLVLATALALPVAAHADPLDDELAAARTLLIQNKVSQAGIRFDALMKKAREAISADAANAHAHYILGAAAMFAGSDQVAVESLDLAMRLDPVNPRYALTRAQLASFQEKPAEAIVLLRTVVKDHPDNIEAWTQLGAALAETRQFADAQASFQRAADLAPKESVYVRLVAQVLWDQKKEDQAIAAYNKALEIDPKDTLAQFNVGLIEQLRGRHDAALDAYAKVLVMDPNESRAIAKQIQIYQAQNKTKERDEARERILALHKAGKISASAFCRDQFPHRGMTVIALEYFEFKSPRAMRYAFYFLNSEGGTEPRQVILGSFDVTNQAARAAGTITNDQRVFQLDLLDNMAPATLGVFPVTEPSYEQVRDLVKSYLDGILKPVTIGESIPPNPAP